MEMRFGHDFSRVRVHTSAQAAESAQAVNAFADTAPQDVAFGSGQYSPASDPRKRLLAHESMRTFQHNDATSLRGGVPRHKSRADLIQSKADAGSAISSSAETEAQAASSGGRLLSASTAPGGAASHLAARPSTCSARPQAAIRSEPTASSAALPATARKFMEQRLGASFASVRIHAGGSPALETARSGARAITRGEEISFAPGQFAPHTQEGMALIAHELTHVVQQRRGVAGRVSSMARLEQEAQTVERSLLSHATPAAPVEHAPRGLYRADFGEVLEVARAAASGGVVGAANHIVSHYAADDPLIRRVDRLRKLAAKRVREIVFPASLIRRLQALYEQIKAAAPSWLPLPDIQFVAKAQPAGPLLVVAGVAITAEALLLLLALLIIFLWLLGNLDPATRRARERAVEDVLDGIEDLLKPKPVPKPKVEPKPEPKPKPKPEKTTDPVPPVPKRRRRRPSAYPICWPMQLPPPPKSFFVRTRSPERDLNAAQQARMQLEWRSFRDPDFDPRRYHVHHVVPLFLGGEDNLRTNAVTWPKPLHLRGHRILQIQPQMAYPPPPLRLLPTDLYRHPPGTPYELVGLKWRVNEPCL